MTSPKAKMLLGDLGILLVALIWGSTNVIIRDALAGITPLWFCTLRFAVACATVWLLFRRQALTMTRRGRITGSLIGTAFVCAYLLGAVGLLYTTAGNQSFLISMSVVFVPLAVWAGSRRFPGWHVIAAVALCTAGMAGLMLGEGMSVNLGDVLSFAAMLFVTAYILLVQKFVKDADPYGLVVWQATGGMLLAFACSAILEPFPAHIGTAAWLAIVHCGTVGFALTLVLQNVAQKYTSATHAAILLSTSSVFGSVLGVIFLGEPMTPKIFVSSALILMGVLVAELAPALKRGASGK